MQKNAQFAGLIVAAGSGQRAGGGMPKQFRNLNGEMVLVQAARALLAHPLICDLLVVTAPEWAERADQALLGLADPRIHLCVAGGDTRQESVRAGLLALRAYSPTHVLIHDAARPFLSQTVIQNVMNGLGSAPGAIPCLPMVDALWSADQDSLNQPIPRNGIMRAQTPQGFEFDAILDAHTDAASGMADDAAIARAAGLRVAIVAGDAQNLKLTTPEDFEASQKMTLDIRTGNGFDVHAFTTGDHVILCGHRIEHGRGLAGHSDADVGLHALTDAIFGALAEGDIGQWFPPSDAHWKGADSAVFLRKAAARAAERGFAITHLDCTLICEFPKIGPHINAMRQAVASICGIDMDRVSVKATTTERLGFAGRGEGIAAMATATLVVK